MRRCVSTGCLTIPAGRPISSPAGPGPAGRHRTLPRDGWNDYDRSAIQVTQKKAGHWPWILYQADLKAELTQCKQPTTCSKILMTPALNANEAEQGLQKLGDFQEYLARIRKRGFHDLRKASAFLPAEADRPALGIAAVTKYMSLKNLETRGRGGLAGTGGHSHRDAGRALTENIGNWAGNPLEIFVHCRLKQKLTWASMRGCGTPLSEMRMVRRPLRRTRRPVQQ